MMRTLVLVLGLLAVILATGGSFVVRAQGVGSATLEYRCAPKSAPSGIDTLMRCTFTARNTGGTVLANARLVFQPAANLAIPDAYYFFRARRDGVDLGATANGLDYAFGDLAPGASRTLDIDVIARSTHRAGADAVLVAGPTYARYASVTISAEPGPPTAAPLAVTLTRWDTGDTSTPVDSTTYKLDVQNGRRLTLRNVRIELAYGQTATLDAPASVWEAGATKGYAVWALPDPLAPGDGAQSFMRFKSDGSRCPFVYPAVVVTADGDAGRTMTVAAISDRAASLGACTGQGGGGDASALSLPQGGTGGGTGGDSLGMPAPVFALVLGLLLVAAGLSVRRVR